MDFMHFFSVWIGGFRLLLFFSFLTFFVSLCIGGLLFVVSELAFW